MNVNRCRKCGAPVSGNRAYHVGCRPTIMELAEQYERYLEELRKKHNGSLV